MASSVPVRSPQRVRRRLRSLIAGEIVSIVVLPATFFGVLHVPLGFANLFGTAVLVLLLLQGAAYWLAKLRHLERPARPLPGLAVFAWLRAADPVLLGVAGLVIVIALVVGPPRNALLGLGFWVLAVLEYVNYFHRQLMYDNAIDLAWMRHSGLKRAGLARDLDRHRRGARRA